MNKILLLLIILNLNYQFCTAQKKHIIDSLEIKLKMYDDKNLSLADSSKSLILFALCNSYASVNDKGIFFYDDKATDYANECLSFSRKINYKKGIGYGYLMLGKINLLNEANDSLAITMLEKALIIFKENKDTNYIKECYYYLSQLYERKSDFSKALDYANENKKLVLPNALFGGAMENATVLRLGDKLEKRNAEIKVKEQRKIIFYFAFVLLLVVSFAVFVVRSLRIRNKQNKIILEQKQIVEKRNKEITESIEYALRLQTAILPPERIVKQYLGNSFILYKPKDIVAGDFYWMQTVDDLVLFAACDCTGHGVPGAMVSVVCHNALNKAVKEFGLTQPAAILDKTTELVIENFSKSEEEIKDGMDISLCAYNSKTNTIQWAGANNPLWLIQNGEFIEIKADKQPIGMNEDSKPFTNHTFRLNTADTIYLFTDGFADQFGGETGQKKLTRKRFKDLIMSIQSKTLQEQGAALDKFITDFRKEIEQIDDILIMGVRI